MQCTINTEFDFRSDDFTQHHWQELAGAVHQISRRVGIGRRFIRCAKNAGAEHRDFVGVRQDRRDQGLRGLDGCHTALARREVRRKGC